MCFAASTDRNGTLSASISMRPKSFHRRNNLTKAEPKDSSSSNFSINDS